MLEIKINAQKYSLVPLWSNVALHAHENTEAATECGMFPRQNSKKSTDSFSRPGVTVTSIFINYFVS